MGINVYFDEHIECIQSVSVPFIHSQGPVDECSGSSGESGKQYLEK